MSPCNPTHSITSSFCHPPPPLSSISLPLLIFPFVLACPLPLNILVVQVSQTGTDISLSGTILSHFYECPEDCTVSENKTDCEFKCCDCHCESCWHFRLSCSWREISSANPDYLDFGSFFFFLNPSTKLIG